MTHEILINVTPQETRVAMLEQGVVQELHMERASARGLVGNIYLGRVARVLIIGRVVRDSVCLTSFGQLLPAGCSL